MQNKFYAPQNYNKKQCKIIFKPAFFYFIRILLHPLSPNDKKNRATGHSIHLFPSQHSGTKNTENPNQTNNIKQPNLIST
jgi:hypothetical protein